MTFMPSRFCTLAALVCCLVSPIQVIAEEGRVTASRLRCEALVDPLGAGTTTPELTWIALSDERDQRQLAYHMVVASTPEAAEQLNGDLWDTGPTLAGFGPVAYAGKPLRSGDRAYWRVRLQDSHGDFGDWSEIAHFSIGPLTEADWQSDWIGYDRAVATTPEPAEFGAARRIARPTPGAGPPTDGPAGEYFLARNWRLPDGVEIASAELLVAGDDNCGFAINGKEVAHPIFPDQPMLVDVRPYLVGGINRLRARVGNASAGPTGLAARLILRTPSGEVMELVSNSEWKASSKAFGSGWAETSIASFETPAVDIGEAETSPWGPQTLRHLTTAPAAYLRREFDAAGTIVHATLSVATLGWADVTLNGQAVNTDFFSSGWTDYEKRVYCRTYDVTGQVRAGANALGVVLSPGWYGGHIGWKGERDHYGSKPRVRLQLRVEYEDGSIETVGSDAAWRAGFGPITAADILVGEEYDARRELGAWDSAGYDAAGWDPASVGGVKTPPIEPHPGPAVVIVEEFPAQSVTEPAPGVFVFDLGQNFAGVARLTVRGRQGQRLQLRFGERLNDDGTLYHTNMRYARATDYYTCRGGDEETWTPRHTFHGFQYVEVTGLDTEPDAGMITGLALSSDTPLAGEFKCSSPMLNQLVSNILWTQRANFIDIPTDCPQRDERLGWTGDAQVYVNAACLNADSQAFFDKWLVDLVDAQRG
ncbi:MAG: family 78 glycoside hydrolase catalytic domain, partial [Planctomycetota bacterium]